jgi:CAAX protease family protein
VAFVAFVPFVSNARKFFVGLSPSGIRMTAMKGRRKTTRNVPVGIKIGGYVLPPQIVIAGLLSLLYVFFLIGGSYNSRDIVIQLIYFALFGVMIFVLRATQRYYSQLAYAYLVLAIPPMLWYVVNYLGYGPVSPELGWFLWVGIVSLVLGIGLTAALLYFDKGKISDIYVQAGNLRESLRTGATVLVASVVLTVAYIIMHTEGADMSLLLPAIGGLTAFAVACAVAEELWFRGLLLSRLVPMTGEKAAIAIQAIAFAAYEAAFIYMLNPDAMYAGAVFVVAGIAGALLAWMTLKNKSLLAAVMAHTGLYLIIALPLFAQFF